MWGVGIFINLIRAHNSQKEVWLPLRVVTRVVAAFGNRMFGRLIRQSFAKYRFLPLSARQ